MGNARVLKQLKKCARFITADESHFDRTTDDQYVVSVVDPVRLEVEIDKRFLDRSVFDQLERLSNLYELGKRYTKNRNKLYQTAARILTEKQLTAFYLRYAVGLREQRIADYCKVSQPMIALALRHSIHKLKEALCATD